MTIFFWLAGAVAMGGLLIHSIAGSRHFIQPVLADTSLNPVFKALIHVSWHSVSISFLSYGLALFYVALYPPSVAIAVFVAAMCAATALLFIILGLAKHSVLIRMPGGYLCAAIAGLTIAGLLTQ